ncbi:MAG: hypothetical protein KAX55_15195, partial [Propionivibrio sp.]|nr:hypothetical protein [Propionivibrio sp.]
NCRLDLREIRVGYTTTLLNSLFLFESEPAGTVLAMSMRRTVVSHYADDMFFSHRNPPIPSARNAARNQPRPSLAQCCTAADS